MFRIRTNQKLMHLYVFGIVGLVLAIALALSVGVVLAAKQPAAVPGLGSAAIFTILGGPAVTCTNSTIIGDVGAGFPGAPVTQTSCTVVGKVHAGDAVAGKAYSDFLSAYDKFAAIPCDVTLTGTLAGLTLSPGVYCFDAAAALTGLLTLDAQGNPNAVWIFKVGTLGTGALTGTNFSMKIINGGQLCNVYWWVAEAATLTNSNFIGTILAGAAITVKGGTFDGDALAKAAVTLTDANITGCERGHGGGHRSRCNQGLGNGPEGCDPGNSNNHNPTNDESGGTPGDPGRKY
jgi:hypothetical protein